MSLDKDALKGEPEVESFSPPLLWRIKNRLAILLKDEIEDAAVRLTNELRERLLNSSKDFPKMRAGDRQYRILYEIETTAGMSYERIRLIDLVGEYRRHLINRNRNTRSKGTDAGSQLIERLGQRATAIQEFLSREGIPIKKSYTVESIIALLKYHGLIRDDDTYDDIKIIIDALRRPTD